MQQVKNKEEIISMETSAAIEELTRDADIRKDMNIRDIQHIKVEEAVRQGDIYVHRVNDDHPRGARMNTQQLAEGTSKGSRHVAEAPAETYVSKEAPRGFTTTLLGPVIVSDRPFMISHPEHANFRLPAGTYQVTHQMDARTLKRVQD
jgi:hypothetical protein